VTVNWALFNLKLVQQLFTAALQCSDCTGSWVTECYTTCRNYAPIIPTSPLLVASAQAGVALKEKRREEKRREEKRREAKRREEKRRGQ